ncbi:hypothetical protein N7509_005672 [Penicillium cosmopolitanum]|uniref:DUF8035 domain-containing protein n=1 Tax=Penicillium cosmopolitanum TaxID=1131564 RepID=A0A9W9W2L6_9EURO|nr:uncharacterized protein N7509_005672 [Penicillium cosmopolitanum]KAJ5397559.1 hypothetical protein N7509_005672 [Penicillium cosmopolitanum]
MPTVQPHPPASVAAASTKSTQSAPPVAFQRPVPRPRFWTTPIPRQTQAMGYHRTLSPTGGKGHLSGPRSSTGMVQLPSSASYDPYENPRRHLDYDDYYPSDVGYGTHRYQPRHRSTVDIQPTSSQTYRDSGHSKRRTEYAIQPHSSSQSQPQTRHSRSRSNTTTSATDLHNQPLRIAVPSGSHLRPATAGRIASPLLTESGHLVQSPSHHAGHHRRVYSNTDYASDTGRLESRESDRHRSHGSRRVHPPPGHRRYPPYDGLKKGDDIDKYDAYSYTTPREQFDRDYPVKPRHPTTRSSVDRPLSMNLMEEHPQGSGHDRSLVVRPHDSDDGYESYNDPHRRSHHGRSHRDNDRHSRDDRSPRPHNGNGDMALATAGLATAGLGTAALGAGYSDLSDYDHRSRNQPRRSHDPERDYEPPKHSSRDVTTRGLDVAAPSNPEKKKHQYLEPSDHHRSRPRRRSGRRSESDSEGYTDDDDLRKYRHEPSATARRRHSSTDTSSGDERSRHQPRDRSRSRHRSSRSQRMLEDHRSSVSSHPSPSQSRDDVRKPITVEPAAQKEPESAPKGILKAPRQSFPEEPNPIREGVAPLKDANKQGIPPDARWTKIDRRLVNPEALDAGNERYENRSEYVIVLRVLSKDEVQMYAVKTQEIRDARHKEQIEDKRRRMEEKQRGGHRGAESSSDDEDEGDEPLKIEAPPVGEQRPALPTRPHQSHPHPSQPHPSQPHSSQPHPSQPHPSQPHPSQPHPSQPYPSQPYPSQPHSSHPHSSQPHPSHPHPSHSQMHIPSPRE